MKRLIILVLFLFLFSCQEKFNPNDFKGSWISLDSNESFNDILPTFTFQNDSVFIETLHTYGLKGNYKQKNNKIILFLKNDTLQYRFNYNSKDSSIFINGNKYFNYPGFFNKKHFLNYELIDLNKEKNITSDSLNKFDNGFHLFKDSKDSLKLKLNDRITADFEMIPRFVIGHHQFEFNGSVIYLDENLVVRDLMRCYAKLWQVNIKSHLLITGYDIKTNLYSGFKDRMEFWQEQINFIVEEKVVPIRPKVLTRNQFLEKYSPKIIHLNNMKDISLLESIDMKNNYLVQINVNLNLDAYISIKEKVTEIRKNNNIRIRTEFNIYLDKT